MSARELDVFTVIDLLARRIDEYRAEVERQHAEIIERFERDSKRNTEVVSLQLNQQQEEIIRLRNDADQLKKDVDSIADMQRDSEEHQRRNRWMIGGMWGLFAAVGGLAMVLAMPYVSGTLEGVLNPELSRQKARAAMIVNASTECMRNAQILKDGTGFATLGCINDKMPSGTPTVNAHERNTARGWLE